MNISWFVRDEIHPCRHRSDLHTRNLESLTEIENSKVPTIIRCAAAGFTEGLTWCLEQGHDMDTRGPRGWTPFHAAAAYNQAECLRILHEAGAILYTDDFGCTPRWIASRAGSRAASEYLYNVGHESSKSAAGTSSNSSLLVGQTTFPLFIKKEAGLRGLSKVAAQIGKSARELKPAFDAEKNIADVTLNTMHTVLNVAYNQNFSVGWEDNFFDPLLDNRDIVIASAYRKEGELDRSVQRELAPVWPPAWSEKN